MERNGRKGSLVMEPTERWTPQLASDLYDVASWGKGYFSVGENGHVRVHPEKEQARQACTAPDFAYWLRPSNEVPNPANGSDAST